MTSYGICKCTLIFFVLRFFDPLPPFEDVSELALPSSSSLSESTIFLGTFLDGLKELFSASLEGGLNDGCLFEVSKGKRFEEASPDSCLSDARCYSSESESAALFAVL